jgi:hypothetical protein
MTKNILFASKPKGLVTNINNSLVIIRHVNADASPDVPAKTAHAPFGEQVAHAPFMEMTENGTDGKC